MNVQELDLKEAREAAKGVFSLQHDQVIVNQNGLDLRPDSGFINQSGFHDSQAYARKCFSRIVGTSKSHAVLGPLMVDYLFGRSITSNLFRPDAITFKVDDISWEITELFEFKSSKRNHEILRKLKGFSELLTTLRAQPEYLQTLIADSCSEVWEVPEIIKIPDDKDIAVVFMMPNNNLTLDSSFLEPRFQVRRMIVK